jgi:hypothetical protein
MDQKLQSILEFVKRPAVEYNLPQNKYWGVTLVDNSIIVASGFFTIEISNIKLDEKPETNFFSYFEEKFSEYAYPLNVPQIHEKVSSQCEFVGKITLPVTNIINRLMEIDKHTSLKKCRIVVSPGYLESGELTLKFVQNGGHWEFKHQALPKPIHLSKDSVIKEDGIRPDVVYRCVAVGETADCLEVNAVEPYGKMRLGVLYSPNGFVPTNIEDVNRMTGIIPPDMIICTNVAEPEQIPAPPIHLDGSMMFDLLKVFLLCADKVEMHLPNDPNKPVMFTNVMKSEDDLMIRIVAATLNPFFGAQRR